MARPILGVGGRKGWSCVFLLRGDYKVLQILNMFPRVNKKPSHDRQQNYILATYQKMEKCIDINFWNFNLGRYDSQFVIWMYMCIQSVWKYRK